MTTQPQSGAAMEPTQAEHDLINQCAGCFSTAKNVAAIRKHIASETAELRKQLTDSKAKCAAQAAQIDTLRAAIKKIHGAWLNYGGTAAEELDVQDAIEDAVTLAETTLGSVVASTTTPLCPKPTPPSPSPTST